MYKGYLHTSWKWTQNLKALRCSSKENLVNIGQREFDLTLFFIFMIYYENLRIILSKK